MLLLLLSPKALLLGLAAALLLLAAPSLSAGTASCNDYEDTIYDPSAPLIYVDPAIHRTSSIPFRPKSGPGPLSTYLQLSLPYAPAAAILDQLRATPGVDSSITSRGEAHITVITPPEFDSLLAPLNITADDINRIALRHDIQSARFLPVCLGRVKGTVPAKHPTRVYELYSLIVDDIYDDLLRIRRDIYRLYRRRGGQGALFRPEEFFPH
ncbi:hypothetical protein EV182_000871, partial [Spiromyces aspiralis]